MRMPVAHRFGSESGYKNEKIVFIEGLRKCRPKCPFLI